MEMDTDLGVVGRSLPCGSFGLGLLDRSLEDNVEVEDHFKIDRGSLYVGPLVDHLNDLRDRPFLVGDHHISLELELHHIVDAITNMN